MTIVRMWKHDSSVLKVWGQCTAIVIPVLVCCAGLIKHWNQDYSVLQVWSQCSGSQNIGFRLSKTLESQFRLLLWFSRHLNSDCKFGCRFRLPIHLNPGWLASCWQKPWHHDAAVAFSKALQLSYLVCDLVCDADCLSGWVHTTKQKMKYSRSHALHQIQGMIAAALHGPMFWLEPWQIATKTYFCARLESRTRERLRFKRFLLGANSLFLWNVNF